MYPKVTTETWWFQITKSFLGAMIPIRRLSRQIRQEAMTHPLPQERALNIATWFGIVVDNDFRQIDVQQQFDFFARLISVVEDVAKSLKWEPLTWGKEHGRLWLPES